MKLKLKKQESEWIAAIHRGNGGVSSLIIQRNSKRFIKAIGIFFSIKYMWRGLTW